MHSPVLIVIAGPNGSGKTSVTSKILHHEWMEGGHDVPITKIISRYDKSIANSSIVSEFVDRAYIYDNSIEDVDAQLLFRLKDGKLVKQYVDVIPRWALAIYGKRDN